MLDVAYQVVDAVERTAEYRAVVAPTSPAHPQLFIWLILSPKRGGGDGRPPPLSVQEGGSDAIFFISTFPFV